MKQRLGCVNVEIDPLRLLKMERVHSSLPVFAVESLRTSKNSSIRFYPGGWVAIVAGNELFLWKYLTTSQAQSRSACLRFSLPSSDLPHTARLVCLLPSPNGPDTASTSLFPAGCLALSPCGQSLRLWPQLTRNNAHTDVTPSALVNCLYGDEAIQMESTSMSGIFVLATRTAHLMMVDARNVQAGVTCRLLSNQRSVPTPGQNGSLLSGLSRRVSNLLSIVASSGGLSSRLPPLRGENTTFVRLLTQQHASSGACFIYMLMDHQLDIWCLDDNLEEHMESSHAIESLLSPQQEFDKGAWRAVDMSIRCGSEVSTESSVLFVLTKPCNDSFAPVWLISLAMNGTQIHPAQTVDSFAVLVEWPFPSSHLGCFSDSWELCLPALSDGERTGRGTPAYPCLLASICRPSLGQVVLVEVLTGKTVAKIDFGSSSSAGDSHSSGVVALSGVLGCGSVDTHNLFVYVTNQHGLFSLVPTVEISEICFTQDEYARRSSDLVEGSKTPKLKSSQDVSHIESYKLGSDRGSMISLRTQSRTLLVTVRLIAEELVVCDASDPHYTHLKLSSSDLTFVTLCEAARIYWMGFEEQARKYLARLTSQSDLCSALPAQLLRLTKRVINESPRCDPRWRRAFPNQISPNTPTKGSLTPEGCIGFQFVTSLFRCSEPVLPQSRFDAKTEAISRLVELFRIAVSTSPPRTTVNSFVPITEVSKVLGYCLPYSGSCGNSNNVSSDEAFHSETRRWLAGELEFSMEPHEKPLIREQVKYDGLSEEAKMALDAFDCSLIDESTNAIESLAARLAVNLDADRIKRAADDYALSGIDQHASVHILCGLRVAGELVEFARGIHSKLSRNPEITLQPVFRSVAIEAGFPSESLHMFGPQEAIFQTISLIPTFVTVMGEAVDSSLRASVEVDPDSSMSPSIKAAELLLLCSSLISTGLAEVMRYRSRQIKLIEMALTDSPEHTILVKSAHFLACWLTDARPFGIGDVLLQLLEHLVCLGSGGMLPSSTDLGYADSTHLAKEAAVRAVEWVEIILTIAQERVRWATSHAAWAWSQLPESTVDDRRPSEILEVVQRVRRLRFWFTALRKRLICLVADQLDRPELALSLAERFADCTQMVRLCYLLECQDELNASHDLARWPAVGTSHANRFHHQRLTDLLKRVPAIHGLADQALQWYFACGEHARVQSLLSLLKSSITRDSTPYDAKPTLTTVIKDTVNLRKTSSVMPSSVDALSRFLLRGDTRDHAWPHLLSTRQYGKAATILFEEGCKEMRFLGRRKLLLSLAKLSFLISDVDEASEGSLESVPPRNWALSVIELLLECVHMQESVPVHLINNQPESHAPSSNRRCDPVMNPIMLARLYTSGVPKRSRGNKDEHASDPNVLSGLPDFNNAIRLADLIPDIHRFYPELVSINPIETRANLILHIWCQAFKMNDWPRTDEGEDPVQLCGSSFACKLITEVRMHYHNAMELLPTPDELCGCAELEDLSDNPHFSYLLQAGFEYILNTANKMSD